MNIIMMDEDKKVEATDEKSDEAAKTEEAAK